MRRELFLIVIGIVLLGLTPAQAEIIEVPSDHSTIQEAIDASAWGDTVLVAPGTYAMTGAIGVDFDGKGILVQGSGGPELTILDCSTLDTSEDFAAGVYLYRLLSGAGRETRKMLLLK